jgi:hypothetical protein
MAMSGITSCFVVGCSDLSFSEFRGCACWRIEAETIIHLATTVEAEELGFE